MPDLDNLWKLSNVFSVSIDKLMGNTSYMYAGKALIGIDGGGTKTEFVLFTEDGRIISRVLLEGCNPNVCGMDKTCAILKLGVDTMLSAHPDVAGVFAGIAGFLSGDNSGKLKEFFANTYPTLKATLGSDVLNVISSATELDKCIAVICGTGFIVYAYHKELVHRLGGWGYLLDNKGSGTDLGRDALRAALADYDGFGEKTLITSLVTEKLGGDIWKNIDKIYAAGNRFVASFAPLVFEAYKQGDRQAENILQENTDRVAYLINHAAKNCHCGKNVVLAGGLFAEDGIWFDMISQKVEKGLNLMVPSLPQIYGSCARCGKLYGNLSENFTENFQRNYKAAY